MIKKILLLSCIIIISCAETNKVNSQENFKSENEPVHISEYKLPEKLTLCGEEIPLDNPEVRERAEREFYLLLQQPGQVILYLKRAGRYFPMYERLIKERGLPDDLKYLSVAESALYQARSHKGAIGLWQFMKATAKKMGLRVDKYVDERRNPEKSTIAALKYLKSGFDARKSWILSMAGYNMGHTGVKKSKDYQHVDNYFDLYLNEETSRFVFRIAIIKELMINHEKYGFKLSEDDFYKEYKTKEIVVKKSIQDLSAWAKIHGTTYKYVKLLNPWILGRKLNKPKSGQEYKILIPA